jgi:hypothetical protein
MTALPDFKNMTQHEILDWLDNNNLVDLIRTAEPGTLQLVYVPTPEDEEAMVEGAMKITSIRLPVKMLDELDKFKDRDRDGRSGLIREAVERYLHTLREQAA